MSTPYSQKTYALGFRGLVLKKDPGLLEEGQLAEATNIDSIQEGAITQRRGNRRLTGNAATSWGGATVSLVHSINKLRGTSGEEYFYAGNGENIFRSTGPLITANANQSFTKVAVGCAAPGDTYEKQRFSAVRYNAGAIGRPYEFLACPNKMLKDTGTLTNSGDGSHDNTTVIQRWGILPPSRPPLAVLDQITILPTTAVENNSARLNSAIGSVSGTGPGPIVIGLNPATDITKVLEGMLVNVNGTLAIVDLVDTKANTFRVWLPGTPLVTQTVVSGSSTATPSAAPGTVTILGPTGITNVGSGGADTVCVPGAEFDGVAADGYDTEDIVHIAIGITDPSKIQDIRLRVMVYSNSGGDYYEKEILPSQLQQQASVTSTAVSVLPTYTQNVDSGTLGDFDVSGSEDATGAKPQELNQISPNTTTLGTPMWTEIDIPKSSFLKVGRAGTGIYTWAKVVGFAVVSVSSATSPPVISIGNIYIAGGFGPFAFTQSANVPRVPLDYLYTFRNTSTGQESNPCVTMIEDNWVTPQRQRVKLTLTSSGDNQISQAITTPVGSTSGKSAISVYRRGGSFSDGLYRLVGYADNSVNTAQVPQSVIFYDSQTDISIADNPILSFDNDPPVRSTLKNPFRASWIGYTGGDAGLVGYNTFELAIISGDSLSNVNQLTPGTAITISPNTNKQETCFIDTVEPGGDVLAIKVYFQYAHSVTEVTALGGNVFVACDSVVGQPCNIALSAFGSVFLAGDKNNPHVLYKSKTGRPEAFPVVELDTGVVNQINVGSPSNPIMNMTEFNGEIICMNLEKIYAIQIFQGQMQAPTETPATRGLYTKDAWCKAENEIWYLSYDGIYSWSGGQSAKRSEAIDPIFHGYTIGPYSAVDLSILPQPVTGVILKDIITMAYSKQRIYVVYVGTDGAYHRLRYDMLYDRWSVENIGDAQAGSVAVTTQYVEQDTGFKASGGTTTDSNLLIAKSITNSGTTTAYLYMDDVGTSDGWVTAVGDGGSITYAITTGAFDGPASASFNKQFSDYVVELNNDNAAISLQVYYDYSTVADGTDSITIPIGGGAQRRRFAGNFQAGFGKEAYAIQMRYSGSTTGNVYLYATTINFFSLEQITAGRAFDWDDLGNPNDKRLYEITVWFDAKSAFQTYTMDIITGVTNSQVINFAVQDFVLIPPSGPTSGANWSQVTFPINDSLLGGTSIVKKIRFRPKSVSGSFIVRDYKVQYEELPADVVYFTPWKDYGYKYSKYAQQVVLDIDTGGVACSISLFKDGGVSASQTFSVTSTNGDRIRRITLTPQIEGSLFRLTLTPGVGVGAKAQLFSEDIIWLPSDRGPVTHSFDWDMLGWPYDKKFSELSIEYDNSGGNTVILMDTLTGVNGTVQTIGAQSFTLTGTGRSLQTFPLPDGTVAKMIRLHPQSDTTSFKEWKYVFQFEKYPPDIVYWVQWSDLGWKCHKTARNLILNIDTGGVAASIAIQADGVTVQTISVTTTTTDRERIIALNSNLTGKLWRLLITPGTNGKSQLFNAGLDFVAEPCGVSFYDSYEQDFGFVGWKALKQAWISYTSSSPVTFTVITDNTQTFYTVTLPAKSDRGVFRFYFPAISANGLVLNKSKKYRIQLSSSSDFRLYANSIIEFIPFGTDQRGSFSLTSINAEQQLPVAQPQVGMWALSDSMGESQSVAHG